MWANQDGEFIRKETRFRDWVRADGSTRFAPERGRYHLYISKACPWASRTYAMRQLRKLDDVISLSIVSPVWGEKGWTFGDGPGTIPDTVNGARDLLDLYRMADPEFSDEETVPVLWDKKLRTIVNNESLEIMRMLDVEFRELGDSSACFYPEDLRPAIDATIRRIYNPINNGVYRAGFAERQPAYERAVRQLFAELDHWDELLGRQRYLCGSRLTEADICFFTTLVRFDSVYYSHFKCNLKRIVDYRNLWPYLRDLYQTPGITETVDLVHIKEHYYCSQTQINPTGIVPLGPLIDFDLPHYRDENSNIKLLRSA